MLIRAFLNARMSIGGRKSQISAVLNDGQAGTTGRKGGIEKRREARGMQLLAARTRSLGEERDKCVWDPCD